MNLQTGSSSRNPFSSLINLLMVAGVLFIVYLLVTGFVKLIYFSYVPPVLLALILVINYKVALQYLSDLGATFQKDVLTGIVWVLFAVFCYPFLLLWLLIKALFYRKIEQIANLGNQQGTRFNISDQPDNRAFGEFADYEEIDTKKNTPTHRDKKA